MVLKPSPPDRNELLCKGTVPRPQMELSNKLNAEVRKQQPFPGMYQSCAQPHIAISQNSQYLGYLKSMTSNIMFVQEREEMEKVIGELLSEGRIKECFQLASVLGGHSDDLLITHVSSIFVFSFIYVC